MSNLTYLCSTKGRDKPLWGKCPAKGNLLMASLSIPIFWYMLFDEDSLILGLGKGAGDDPDYRYLHLTTPTKEGLARAEGRWPSVSRILGSEVTPLFRSWLAFLRKKTNTYLHCETAELYWMFGSHINFKKRLCTCLGAFDHIPKRVKAGAIPNRWWDILLAQAHVGEQAGQLKPLGNLSYCGFGYRYKVPWSVDGDAPCGTMAENKSKVQTPAAATEQQAPAPPSAPLEVWGCLLDWMRANAPELLLGLAPPAADAEIEDTERFLGVTFPDDLRWLYRQHNGSIDYTGPPLDGGIWLSLEGMRRTWTMWKDTYDAYSQAGVWNDIPGEYAHETWIPSWVPLTDSEGGGWAHWVDLDPGPKGTLGQILLVYSDSTAVVASSLCMWLWNYLGELEAGKWVRSKDGGLRRHDAPDR